MLRVATLRHRVMSLSELHLCSFARTLLHEKSVTVAFLHVRKVNGVPDTYSGNGSRPGHTTPNISENWPIQAAAAAGSS